MTSLPILALLLMLWQVPMAMAGGVTVQGSGSVPEGRLGFGFAPGLVAGRDYVIGQLIVGLDQSDPEGAAAMIVGVAAGFGGKPGGEIPGSAVLLDFPTEAAALRAVDALLGLPAVSFVERNGRMGVPPMPAKPGRDGQLKAPSDPPAADQHRRDGWGWGTAAVVALGLAVAFGWRLHTGRKDKNRSPAVSAGDSES